MLIFAGPIRQRIGPAPFFRGRLAWNQGAGTKMTGDAQDALADGVSNDPVVRRLMRKRELLEAAERLDRESRLDIAHPAAPLQPSYKQIIAKRASSID